MFVLLMLFLFKYIDDVIGKGFEFSTIVQLMLYASATNVAMALPLSILLSSIMAYGSLGENYELVAIKSTGVSLLRAMYPIVILVAILSVVAFIFSDTMLPIANRKFTALLYDVRQQKSANILPEGVFSSSFPGYSIRVNKKLPDGTLLGVMIYTKNASNNNTDVLIAGKGIMYQTPDNQFLVLKLKDGIRYEEAPGEHNFEWRQRFTRFRFKETEQKLDLAFMKMSHTDENLFRTAAQMMNISQLNYFSGMARRQADSVSQGSYRSITTYTKYFAIVKNPADPKIKYVVEESDDPFDGLTFNQKASAMNNALSEVHEVREAVKRSADAHKLAVQNVRHYNIEYQKKFTLSAACIVLFLIGAPLGAIIRRGGLGMPVVVSVIFFLVYYIIWTIGESAAKEGNLSPVIGTWIAIIVLTPVGFFLSYKAANDSALFDIEAYKRILNKLTLRKQD